MIHRGTLAYPLALSLLPQLLLADFAPRRGAIGEEPASFAPTSDYATRQIEGWTVLVNKGLLERRPALAEEALRLLRNQLFLIGDRVPRQAVEILRSIRIWVEEEEPHHPCMAYHPDAGWLRMHGMNPEKARCVEIANVRHFLEWSRDQPWMVLHELAHGYHDQRVAGGFENPEVRDAFDHARAAGRYDSVLKIVGRKEKGYAATNPKEYFAESSEAFFGTNDFFPFVRAELHEYDPEMFAVLGRLWGTP